MGRAENTDAFSGRVTLNLVTNTVRTLLMALVGILMVPYYIDQFGIATYAMLPLATSITNYFLIVSDSLSNAFSRYMVLAVRSGDRKEINRVFSTSLIGMGKCSLILMLFSVLVSVSAPYVFQVGDSAALDVQVMFFLIMSASVLISFGASLGSVYMAYNRLYITYSARAVQTVSQVAVVIFLLAYVPSLPMLGLSFLASAVLMLVIMAALLKYTDPELRAERSSYHSRALREMGTLGLWATLTELGALLFIQTSVIVVNIVLGSEIQGTFSIAAGLIMMIHTACAALSAVSVPLVYREYAAGNREETVRVLRIFSKFVGLTMAFPLAYLMIFAPQILQAWLGTEYDGLAEMLYIMLPAEVPICVAGVLAAVPVVFGRVKPFAVYTLLLGAVNIISVATVLTFTDWGLPGVCVCWAISMVLLKLFVYPLLSSKLAETGRAEFLKPVAESYAVFVASLIAMYVLSAVYEMRATWIGVLVPFVLLFVVYFAAEMRFCYRREEREIIKTYLPRFVRRFVSRSLT